MTPAQRARIKNLDHRITILASKVVPLLLMPRDRERYADRLALPKVQKKDR